MAETMDEIGVEHAWQALRLFRARCFATAAVTCGWYPPDADRELGRAVAALSLLCADRSDEGPPPPFEPSPLASGADLAATVLFVRGQIEATLSTTSLPPLGGSAIAPPPPTVETPTAPVPPVAPPPEPPRVVPVGSGPPSLPVGERPPTSGRRPGVLVAVLASSVLLVVAVVTLVLVVSGGGDGGSADAPDATVDRTDPTDPTDDTEATVPDATAAPETTTAPAGAAETTQAPDTLPPLPPPVDPLTAANEMRAHPYFVGLLDYSLAGSVAMQAASLSESPAWAYARHLQGGFEADPGVDGVDTTMTALADGSLQFCLGTACFVLSDFVVTAGDLIETFAVDGTDLTATALAWDGDGPSDCWTAGSGACPGAWNVHMELSSVYSVASSTYVSVHVLNGASLPIGVGPVSMSITVGGASLASTVLVADEVAPGAQGTWLARFTRIDPWLLEQVQVIATWAGGTSTWDLVL